MNVTLLEGVGGDLGKCRYKEHIRNTLGTPDAGARDTLGRRGWGLG